MRILSFQSSVIAGHVGNNAICLPLQRLGFDVWCIDTVSFSNHPAHGGHTGRIAPPEEIAALVDGLEARDLLAGCNAIVSGYLGSPGTGPVVLDAVARAYARNPDLIYVCDPVMGDAGRRYVAEGIDDFFREIGVPAADIVTPNAFEAEIVTGLTVKDAGGAAAAAEALRALGPRIAVVTGLERNGKMETVARDAGGAWRVAAPKIPAASFGAGDLFTGLLTAFVLRERPLPDALARSASIVHDVLRIAADSGAGDLPLVSAQETFDQPEPRFAVQRIA